MAGPTLPARRPIRHLRWWICTVLFFCTVINYIDRQTLSTLAPYLKHDYHWSNEDYALIVIAFRVAYAGGQLTLARLVDRVGTRLSLTVMVTWYSLVSVLTGLAACFRSPRAVFRAFIGFRFLLGLGESPNWPAATKAVAEWFPREESGWAAAYFDAGSSLGGAVAPALVIGLYFGLGRRWWPAFMIVGALGFLWVICWRLIYHRPEDHPRISAEELHLILADRQAVAEQDGSAGRPPPRWIDLIRLRQTWGIVIGRAATDPVWFFITDWFMLFLFQEKHFDPKNTLVAIWIPFVSYDLGNIVAGGLSSWLIRRGWRVENSRKLLIILGALGMTALVPAIYANNIFAVAACFAVSTFCYTGFSLMLLVLPTDLYQSNSVATISGLGGCAAGVVTVVFTYFVGMITTRYSFKPILVASSVIPLIGAALVVWLVRNPRTELERNILRRI
jgi:ACS family hexuronate transporter-like MFS transporter